jgi:hypothetical protein
MRTLRWLVLPVFLIAVLGCGLANGLQQAVTQLPNALTGMPTALEAMGTAAAGQMESASATPAAGRLNIALDSVKKVQQTGRYTFTDTTEGGQHLSTAVLINEGGSILPVIVKGFSARFIGDPANLSRILVTVPGTEDPATAYEEIGLINDLLEAALPRDVVPTFVPWLTQNFPPVSGEQQTTIKNLRFTLKKSGADVILEVDPAP